MQIRHTYFFIIITLIFIYFSPCVYGQSTSLSGTVVNSTSGQPIVAVSIRIVYQQSQLVVIETKSDETGRFTIRIEPSKNLEVIFEKKGYSTKVVTNVTTQSATDVLQNVFLEQVTHLEEVSIKGRKPLIVYDADKITFNPQNMPGLASMKVFDLFKNLPGVMVENDNIRLNGNTDIQILVDDRKRSFTIEQAVKLLKSMPANSIKSVEIMNGKSARYDASGSGGVINIVTKKNAADGYNFSLTNGISFDDFVGSFHNSSFSFKRDKISIYGSLNYDNDYSLVENQSSSTYSGGTNAVRTTDNQIVNSRTKSPYVDLALDYAINKMTTVGVAGSIYYGKTTGEDRLSTNLDPVDVNSVITNKALNLRDNLNNIDFIYVSKFDSLGSKVKIDLGYISGFTKDQPTILNTITDILGNRSQYNVIANIPLEGHQYIFQLDNEKIFNKNNTLKFGGKITRGSITNNTSYDTLRNNNLYKDFNRSSNLGYSENTNALYSEFKHKFSPLLSAVAGLRFEDTKMINEDLISRGERARSFRNFFPNFSLSYNGKDIKTTLTLNRTINRPYYGYLNNYERYIDEFTIQQGNENLNPSFTYGIGIGNMYKGYLTFNFGYQYTRNVILLQRRQVENSILTLVRPENASNNKMFYFTLAPTFSFFDGKWSGQVSISGFFYKSSFNPGFFTSSLDQRRLGLIYGFTYHQIEIAKKTFLEFSYGFYGPNRSNQMFIASRSYFNTGLKKEFFKDKLSIAFNVNDLFNTYLQDRQRYYDGYNSQGIYNQNIRRFKFSLTVNLGKLRSATPPNTSAKQESSRFKSN
ncbi:outer membrane beta-barrel protein [Pedobacter sp. CFBP9032]|uniref:outer membrane beta-barrel protein n=1 Tax=Pedobacter sp. CFBP9032 TaxID=3096539 RepID=UPI002A6A1B15|nr:outer membrane beta-barrel protein [Pedobacter sp. CFBP9032]MDY0905133.1 TonB-dependent receptor [Pedobacter sp. CFBP9032]